MATSILDFLLSRALSQTRRRLLSRQVSYTYGANGRLLRCADIAGETAPTASPIFTRVEAARYLRVSIRAFDVHVRGNVPEHRIGRKPLFRKVDLDKWLDQQRVGNCESAVAST